MFNPFLASDNDIPSTYDNATGGQEGQEKGDERWYVFSSPFFVCTYKNIDCAYTTNVLSNCHDDVEPLVCFIFMFYCSLYIFFSNVHLQMKRLKIQPPPQ